MAVVESIGSMARGARLPRCGTPNDRVFNGRLFGEQLFSRGDQASSPPLHSAGGADGHIRRVTR